MCIVIFNLILSHFSVAFPLVLQYNLWHWKQLLPKKRSFCQGLCLWRKVIEHYLWTEECALHYFNQSERCLYYCIFCCSLQTQPSKNHKQRRRQSCFFFYVAKGLLPFKSLLLLCLWHYGNNKPDDVWYLGTICKFYARGWSVLKDHRTSGQIDNPSNHLIMDIHLIKQKGICS